MKKAIPILLTVFLAVSCSQVVYDKLPPEDIGGASTTVTATQQDTSRNILLTFEPVPYAYSFGDGTPIPFEADEYENGMLSYQIYASRVPSNEGTVKLFGRISGSTSWVELGENTYRIEVDEDEIPDVYVYERNTDNVVLKVNPSDSSKTYLYKTVVMAEDNELVSETEFAQASDNKITIPDLKSDEIYFVNVYQKETLGAPDPETYAAVEVPVFEHEVKLSLSTNENGFVVSGIENGTQEIQLKNRDNESLSVVKNVEDINNGSVEISFSEVPSLESGLFYVYSTNGSVVSNNIKTTTPVSILSTTPNYRSVDFEIKFSSLIDVSSIDFSANDSTTAYSVDVVSVDSDNKTIISIKDLKSNTPYAANRITLGVTDVDVSVPEFTTKSFAGKFFKWDGILLPGSMGGSEKNTNFIIYVDDKKDGSLYPYYVYFSENDDAINGDSAGYVKSNLRIMPLVDFSANEPLVDASNYVNYDTSISAKGDNLKLQNDAYKVNSKKWNSLIGTLFESFGKISNWYLSINSSSGKIGDEVETITYSKSLLGYMPTETVFCFDEFRNSDNVAIPYVKFKNTGYGTSGETVNSGIYSNGNPDNTPEAFGDFSESKETAKYCWYLTPVNLTEGGAE